LKGGYNYNLPPMKKLGESKDALEKAIIFRPQEREKFFLKIDNKIF
jgi:hypothetical protein